MEQRRPKRKMLCECGNPVDRTLPTKELQCGVCFERNKFALRMHERTRKWLDEQEWAQSMARKALQRWRSRRGLSFTMAQSGSSFNP